LHGRVFRLATLGSTSPHAILPGGAIMKQRNSHNDWTKEWGLDRSLQQKDPGKPRREVEEGKESLSFL